MRNGRFFVVGSSGTPNESLKDAFAADGFSRRLAAAGANALLGLCFDGGILVAILLSKVIYQLVEAFRWDVALLTLIGLLWASANAESLHALPDFMRAKTRRFYLSAVSGWPVCVPIQTSPPSNTSFFQIGTVFLISSMAKRLAANAASRCAEETAIITLASPI